MRLARGFNGIFSRLMERYGYSPDVTFDGYVDDFIFVAGKR